MRIHSALLTVKLPFPFVCTNGNKTASGISTDTLVDITHARVKTCPFPFQNPVDPPFGLQIATAVATYNVLNKIH